eukprot:CAMPEP_0117554398 /NCGR_PEP_ID=MMETSP0784-20121206/50735_1 /TAXON_ID=39447 /ORGANISM="" /LENGTH=118 /DNA_ID=CAMNT_0005351565 /DNA_START=231 /DNA_END=584 /DNA_ORIENTATION=+
MKSPASKAFSASSPPSISSSTQTPHHVARHAKPESPSTRKRTVQDISFKARRRIRQARAPVEAAKALSNPREETLATRSHHALLRGAPEQHVCWPAPRPRLPPRSGMRRAQQMLVFGA